MTRLTKRSRTCRNETDADANADDDAGEVKRIGSDIYFYADVTRKNVLKLIALIEECRTTGRFRKQTAPITLHVHSDGGDLHAGFCACDTLKSISSLTTIAEGFVASAATLLVLSGRTRLVRPHTTMLIHQLSTSMDGWCSFEQMKDELHNSEHLQSKLRGIYESLTRLPHDTLQNLMSRDVYLSAEDAVAHGIAHPTP